MRVVPASKFFTWLALFDHYWTSDRLHRHHLPNHGPYALCDQEVETISHLVLGCVYSQEVWFRLLRVTGLQHLLPEHDDIFANWWVHSQKMVQKEKRKGFDSMVVMAAWMLWKERNDRVFNNSMRQAAHLCLDSGRMSLMGASELLLTDGSVPLVRSPLNTLLSLFGCCSLLCFVSCIVCTVNSYSLLNETRAQTRSEKKSTDVFLHS
jgi:hypothetical protein